MVEPNRLQSVLPTQTERILSTNCNFLFVREGPQAEICFRTVVMRGASTLKQNGKTFFDRLDRVALP